MVLKLIWGMCLAFRTESIEAGNTYKILIKARLMSDWIKL